MKLPKPFYKLPVRFDVALLRAETDQFTEADWAPHPQGSVRNSGLILVSVDGEQNDTLAGPLQPTPALQRCPFFQQVMASFDTVVGRSRLMRLAGAAEVSVHYDMHYNWYQRVRIHVPIVTYPGVRFLCCDDEVHMQPGEAWIFDTWQFHNVINESRADRIHLVIDTAGTTAFWNLLDRSWTLDQPSSDREQAELIPFKPDTVPPCGLSGQPGVDTLLQPSQTIRRITSDDAATATAITPNGQIAITADRAGGIVVSSLANPTEAKALARLETPGAAVGVAIAADGSQAFIADDYGGVQVVSLVDPANPVITATIEPVQNGYALGVATAGSRYLFVAASGRGLDIVDRNGIGGPTVVKTVLFSDDDYALSVAASADGRYAYVGTVAGLVIVDALNPATAQVVRRVATGGSVESVAVHPSGSHVLLAAAQGGLKVVSVANPASASVVKTISTAGMALSIGIAPNGSRAYVAAGEQGLHVVDFSNRAAPQLVTTFPSDAPVTGVSLSADGTKLYVASTAGVAILLATSTGIPMLVGVLDTPGTAKATVVSSKAQAVVAVGSAGVFLRDVAPPTGFSQESAGIEAANYGTIETRGTVSLTRDASGGWRANTTPVQTPAGTEAMLGIWQLAEAETVGTANVLFARHPSGAVHRLMADSDWRLIGFSGIGNASSRWLPGTARGEATPANATNPPAPGGVTVPLDVVGSVSLRHDLSGQLYANTTLLTRDGEPVSLGGLADLRPVAAETFTTGQHLLLRSPANASLFGTSAATGPMLMQTRRWRQTASPAWAFCRCSAFALTT